MQSKLRSFKLIFTPNKLAIQESHYKDHYESENRTIFCQINNMFKVMGVMNKVKFLFTTGQGIFKINFTIWYQQLEVLAQSDRGVMTCSCL